jgi:AraC family transcriptional regulator
VGLEASRYCATPAAELSLPANTNHTLILFAHPAEELELRYEGVKRQTPPPAGSISLVPAGCPTRWRFSGHKESLHIDLEPGLVGRVAESFDLDPARLTVPPLDGLDLPHLRTAMLAVDAELTAGGIGGRLVAESLANVMAVQLLRHFAPASVTTPPPGGVLPREKLRAVVDYIHAHLGAEVSLDELAAVAHLSPYHFARLFKNSTGLPPHQYVIARRVERAKELLRGRVRPALAEVAAEVGFADQSHFTRHFRRLVGVTPKRFQ